MATKIEINYVSDFSGALLSEDERVTRKFSIGRKTYVLDMAPDEVDLYERAVAQLTSIATHVPKKKRRRRKAKNG